MRLFLCKNRYGFLSVFTPRLLQRGIVDLLSFPYQPDSFLVSFVSKSREQSGGDGHGYNDQRNFERVAFRLVRI